MVTAAGENNLETSDPSTENFATPTEVPTETNHEDNNIDDESKADVDSEIEGINSKDRTSKTPYRKIIGEHGLVKKQDGAWRKFDYISWDYISLKNPPS